MRIYLSIIFIFFLSNCQRSLESNLDLSVLLARQQELKKSLKDLDQQISVLDTTKKSNFLFVRVAQILSDTFSHAIEVQGNVKSDFSVDLQPEMGGKIEKILVKEGDYVNKGSVIVKLDTDISDEQVRELELALALAVLNYEKQFQLYGKGVGTELEFKKLKTEKETLEKKLKMAQLQGQKSLIIAPFSAYIDKIYAKAGELSSPQTPILRLVDLQKIKIEVEISEMYLNKIKEGSRVELYFPAIDYRISDAVVSHASKYIHTQNRTYTIQIDLNNKEQKLLPNLLVKVKLEDFRQKDAIVIPSKTIMYNNKGEAYVFVLEKDTVHKRKIQVGLDYKNQQNILNGLQVGEWLVTDGYQALADGDAVKILPNQSESIQ
jgi:RND family efflux transporter MFP subunit